ncbi:putative trans-aconitate 2-methyltransferase [Podospora fimiseda]|uniref:Trans-aconitate 2-methyltransferase n=1 Tax=Podospora fimiseda TaxID=252190 RepID=A0AAN7BJ03_9PEZI|nr:putative trans-aconitate 2-methyltransferase [Podospora fimiseda]
MSGNKEDWSPNQYLLFKQARGRAIDDLIAYLGRSLPTAPSRIIDLGCGPGNSTQCLVAQFPAAKISGVDSSPAMIDAAKQTLPSLEFSQADLASYNPPVSKDQEPTLLFSNAVFHWLPSNTRIPTISRLLRTLHHGGALALQVPDNFNEPSHRAMRETASSAEFASYYEGKPKPELDPIEPAAEFYNALRGDCEHVEIWQTHYQHVLENHGDMVEWVRGTGLMPFLSRLPENDAGDARGRFLEEYRKRLEEYYGVLKDGRVVLTYPRLFVVAFR